MQSSTNTSSSFWLLSGCQWRRLALIPISNHLPLITHSGNHHHGNCFTCYGWSSRKPGWIMVPLSLMHPLASLRLTHLFCAVFLRCENSCALWERVSETEKEDVKGQTVYLRWLSWWQLLFKLFPQAHFTHCNPDVTVGSGRGRERVLFFYFTWLYYTWGSAQRVLERGLEWFMKRSLAVQSRFYCLTLD